MSGRGASVAVLAEMAKSANEPFHLIEARFDVADGGTVYATDSFRSVTWGGHTYLALGNFLNYDAVDESAEMKVTQATVTLSGVDQVWMSNLLTLQYIGRTMVVYKAFYNTSGGVIVDPFAILQGPMDEPETSEDPAGGTHFITIRVTSQGADLQAPAGFHTNVAEHQAIFAGDMGFEFAAQVAGELASKSVYWGRSPTGSAAPSQATVPPSTDITNPTGFQGW